MNDKLSEVLNEFFFKTRDELLKELKAERDYQSLDDEAQQLLKAFPIIEELSDGKNMDCCYRLDSEERQAIKRFLHIRMDMQDCLEQKHYFRGHRDCFFYLMQCGIIP